MISDITLGQYFPAKSPLHAHLSQKAARAMKKYRCVFSCIPLYIK